MKWNKMNTLNKEYDILLIHLMNKIKQYYFTQLSDTFIGMGAANKIPHVRDIDYAAQVAAMFILHTFEINMDSNFPDVMELSPDILKALSAFDDLKEGLIKFREKHEDAAKDDRMMEKLIKGSGKFQA